jgi:hypothetical protein
MKNYFVKIYDRIIYLFYGIKKFGLYFALVREIYLFCLHFDLEFKAVRNTLWRLMNTYLQRNYSYLADVYKLRTNEILGLYLPPPPYQNCRFGRAGGRVRRQCRN